MIVFLQGTIEATGDDYFVINVGGVGYRVEASKQTLSSIKAPLDKKILIYHHFTESEQRLFGFNTSTEKKLFEKLITVKGIGPKLGLTILSGLPPEELFSAIVAQNTAALSSVSGVGKKTAERIVLELKDKLGTASTATQAAGTPASPKANALSALESLGFKRRDAEVAIMKEYSAGDSEQDLIKKALKMLR